MPGMLIVEDELELADRLREYFQARGLAVYTAQTGEKGLELLFSEKPDLVLLDLKLGEGIAGIEFLRRARAAKTAAQIVVVTAVDDENMVEMARGLGAVDYVPKPFSLAILEKTILLRLKQQ